MKTLKEKSFRTANNQFQQLIRSTNADETKQFFASTLSQGMPFLFLSSYAHFAYGSVDMA